MGIETAGIKLRMRKAFKEGVSANAFIWAEREAGRSYGRSRMLTDWADASNIERLKGKARYIRKGYVPAANTINLRNWDLSHEYTYIVQYKRTMYPGEPVEAKRVGIKSDVPLTVEEIEREAWERAKSQSPPKPDEERVFMLHSAMRRVD